MAEERKSGETMKQEEFYCLYKKLVHEFTFEEREGVGLYRLPSFSREKGIAHGFTARTGGVSLPPYASLNLSFTNDDRDRVLENYSRFARAAGFPEDSMVMDNYEHGTTVFIVGKDELGRGHTLPSLPPCDGLVTAEPGVTLITGHADCMAFFFYDRKKGIIGLCHAGWRGALGRIGSEVIKKMRLLGSDPKDILAGVGPSICPKCFEVGEDVAKLFEEAFPHCPLRGINEKGNPTVDLWQVALCQFLESGILPEHVSLMGVCTKETDNLYSYRREGRTGGMAAYLRLVEEEK